MPQIDKTLNHQKLGAMVAAILLGLSWFGVAVLGNIVGGLIEVSSDPWIQNSLGRLIVGTVLYLGIVPFVIIRLTEDRYLRVIGLDFSSFKLYLTAGFVILPGLLTLALRYDTATFSNDFASLPSALAAIQPAFIEEILMRGLFVYLLLKYQFKIRTIIIVGATIFSSYHVLSFGLSGLVTGILSIPLLFIPRFMTAAILAPIALHLYIDEGLGTPALLACSLIFGIYGLRWAIRKRRQRTRPEEPFKRIS